MTDEEGPLVDQTKEDVEYERLERLAEGWLSAEVKPDIRVMAATTATRAALIVGRADVALRVLQHLERKMLPATPNYPHRYMVIANMAYCHNALGDGGRPEHYEKAVKLLLRIKKLQEVREDAPQPEPPIYSSWHAVDLAYAYKMLHRQDDCIASLREAASFDAEFEELVWWFKDLHPQLSGDLDLVLQEVRARGG